MLTRHVVATVDEIPPGDRKIVKIAGRSIGVFNLGGEFFALRNQCPHEGGPLCEGYLSGLLLSEEPGEYEYSRKGEILRCPWHSWEFDVRTGQSWFDPTRTRVKSYQAAVEKGQTLLSNPDSSKELAEAGLKKGPYTAETYEVSVERQYVVIEA
jgi:3-phenylpropionate/trans-cinnamate dioxygenase ferredoxin subunit